MHRVSHFPLRLNRHEPLAARLAYRDVAQLAQHVPAVAITQPAELGQEEAAVDLIELDLFRIGIAEAVTAAFAFKAWEVVSLAKKFLYAFSRSFKACCSGWQGASLSQGVSTPLRQPVSSFAIAT